VYAGIKSKILTIQVFLFINTHLCSFLSQILGLCVIVCACVRSCACAKVYVCEVSARLCYNAALSGNSALTFGHNASAPPSRLDDRNVGLSEMSVRNYQSMLRYIPEEGGFICFAAEA
jgi:hypothetical protein